MIPLHRIITALVKVLVMLTAALSIPHARGDTLHSPSAFQFTTPSAMTASSSPLDVAMLAPTSIVDFGR